MRFTSSSIKRFSFSSSSMEVPFWHGTRASLLFTIDSLLLPLFRIFSASHLKIMADNINNPSNPFFLHSSENPALILVTPLLNGRNYHSWARAFRLALQSKNKIKFIDGSLTQPNMEDSTYESWVRCNTMVLSWLQHSVEESILKSILWIHCAVEAWNDLKEMFSQSDIFKVAELQSCS